MPNVGNRKSAAELLRLIREGDFPNGRGHWKELGGGCRHVYLHKKENVVYKVDEDWVIVNDPQYGNHTELRNGRLLGGRAKKGYLGNKIKIPAVSGFTVEYDGTKELVVAMEYAPGRHKMAPAKVREQLYDLKFSDMHHFNYKIDAEGNAWIVDLASPRNEASDDRVL